MPPIPTQSRSGSDQALLSASIVSSYDDYADAVEDLNDTLITSSISEPPVPSIDERRPSSASASPASFSSNRPKSGGDEDVDVGMRSPAPSLAPATPSTGMSDASTRRGEREEKWTTAGSPQMNGTAESSSGAPNANANANATPELERSDPPPQSSDLPSGGGSGVGTEKEGGADASGVNGGEAADAAGQQCGFSAEDIRDIDAILEQISVLESDYESQLTSLRDELRTKEAIIRAVGDQLAEERDRGASFAEMERRMREDAALRDDLIRELQNDLTRMEDDHERILTEQRRHWENEVVKAEAGVKAEAERQFADANACFLRLKADFDVAEAERNVLAEEAREAKARDAKEERRTKARETELLAEAAELRAALAAAEANAAAERRARVEAERAADAREGMAAEELRASREECLSMQRSLAVVVAEKEKLAEETRELQAMCEELLEVVEGAGGEGKEL